MTLADRINTFVDNFYNIWYHYKKEDNSNNNIVIRGINNIITIKGVKTFDGDYINFGYVREQLNKVFKGMELNKDINFIPTIKFE